MASRSKKKTTFAKLAREGRLRERRAEKQAKKAARKLAAENPEMPAGETTLEADADADADAAPATPLDDA